MELEATAPVISRGEILVRAPLADVWAVQTDVAGWPRWQPDVEDVRTDGALAVGSVFRWRTGGLDITSTVEQIDPLHRIVWGGPAQGIVGVHVWTFLEQDGGVLVRTEESWAGEGVEDRVEQLQAALDGSLQTWLSNLRRVAEDQAARTGGDRGSDSDSGR